MKAGRSAGKKGGEWTCSGLGTRSQSTKTRSPASSDLTFFLFASRAASEAEGAEGAGALLAAAVGATDGSARRGEGAGRAELPSGPVERWMERRVR